jgi:hypothetical protein
MIARQTTTCGARCFALVMLSCACLFAAPVMINEFMNVAATRIAPADISLTSGVRFAFAGTGVSLDPSQCAVIVKNRAAFATRYTTNSILIAGEYPQNLSNNDEWRRLKDALYGPFHEFQYHDTWYPGTDGGGYSLTIVDPFGALTNWDVQAGWQASEELYGTPGYIPEPLLTGLLAVACAGLCRARARA